KAGESRQVRVIEGSVNHVEVFQIGSVRTSIIGRPRPLSGYRRAHPPTVRDYTLNCEEPVKSVLLCPPASLSRFDLAFDDPLVVGHLHAIRLEVVGCVKVLGHGLGWFRWSRGSGADAVRLIVVLGQHNGRSLVAQAAVQPLPV